MRDLVALLMLSSFCLVVNFAVWLFLAVLQCVIVVFHAILTFSYIYGGAKQSSSLKPQGIEPIYLVCNIT